MAAASIPSQQMVRCDNRVGAGILLHQHIADKKAKLNKICAVIGQQGEVLIQFVVGTSKNNSPNCQFYHAATVSLKNLSTTEKSVVNIQATIASYRRTSYTTQIKAQENLFSGFCSSNNQISEADDHKSLEDENSVVDSDGCFVKYYPIMNAFNEEHFTSSQIKKDYCQALKIFEIMKRIFKDGVPLPCDERVFSCTFKICVFVCESRIPYSIQILKGWNESGEDIPNKSESSTAFQCQDLSGAGRYPSIFSLESALQLFQENAIKETKPDAVPSDATLMRAQQFFGYFSDRNARNAVPLKKLLKDPASDL